MRTRRPRWPPGGPGRARRAGAPPRARGWCTPPWPRPARRRAGPPAPAGQATTNQGEGSGRQSATPAKPAGEAPARCFSGVVAGLGAPRAHLELLDLAGARVEPGAQHARLGRARLAGGPRVLCPARQPAPTNHRVKCPSLHAHQGVRSCSVAVVESCGVVPGMRARVRARVRSPPAPSPARPAAAWCAAARPRWRAAPRAPSARCARRRPPPRPPAAARTATAAPPHALFRGPQRQGPTQDLVSGVGAWPGGCSTRKRRARR